MKILPAQPLRPRPVTQDAVDARLGDDQRHDQPARLQHVAVEPAIAEQQRPAVGVGRVAGQWVAVEKGEVGRGVLVQRQDAIIRLGRFDGRHKQRELVQFRHAGREAPHGRPQPMRRQLPHPFGLEAGVPLHTVEVGGGLVPALPVFDVGVLHQLR